MTDFTQRLGNTPYPFRPSGGATLAVTSTTGSVALGGTGDQALVTNTGTAAAFVEFGASAVAATTASMAVLPGSSVLITLPVTAGVKATHMAALTASAAETTTLQVSTGWGL